MKEIISIILLGIIGSVVAYLAINLFVVSITAIEYIFLEIIIVMSIEMFNLAIRQNNQKSCE